MGHGLFRRPLLDYATSIGAIGGFLGSGYLTLQLLMGNEWAELNRSDLATHGAYLFLILLLLWLILSWEPKEFHSAPRVITLRDDLIMICDNTPWLGIRVAVSVYVIDGEFEELAAIGEVINVQSNGLVQIRLEPVGSYDTEKIQKKSSTILVRPGVVI